MAGQWGSSGAVSQGSRQFTRKVDSTQAASCDQLSACRKGNETARDPLQLTLTRSVAVPVLPLRLARSTTFWLASGNGFPRCSWGNHINPWEGVVFRSEGISYPVSAMRRRNSNHTPSRLGHLMAAFAPCRFVRY